MQTPITDIIRHKDVESTELVRSHILHPHDDITIFCIISASRENTLSVIEDHLLESISSTGWTHGEEESDFTFVTEKYNHFQRNISEEDIKETSGLLAIMYGDELMVSVIGSMCAFLREKNGELSTIAENHEAGNEFTSVSTGKIPYAAQIFLSSKNLTSFLSDDFFDECAHLSHESFAETIEGILKRETHDTLHIIRIAHGGKTEKKPSKIHTSSRKVNHQIDIARDFLSNTTDSLRSNKSIQRYIEEFRFFFGKKQTHVLFLFLTIGTILFFGLIYILIKAIFAVNETPKIDLKNQILQAQNLIEESQKLTSNSTAFNTNIKQAETILFKMRDNQEYLKDTQDLLQRIEAMKKEMYDIQTIDLSKKSSIIPFNPSDISPIGIFESNKKLNLIGKNSSILGFARGNSIPAVTQYPPGEEVISLDMTDDGNFFFLTKNNRVLSTKRNEITYVNVTGQESWENATKIKTFNNNIYLLDKVGGQIFKHKPGMNGFGQKTEVLTKTLSGILDIGIDGGFYIMTDEPRIYRMISKDGFTQSGLILNKIPGEYTLGISGDAQIIVRPNLNFIYILDGNRIWIFQPDSKQFQDIRSWTYLAQLEISTDQEIRSIGVPSDGQIYVVTNLGVYDIPFEFIDQNIILKN